jgi:hypothetical protein
MSKLYPDKCVRITGWPAAVESGAVDPSVADPGSINRGSIDPGSVDPDSFDPGAEVSEFKKVFSMLSELLAKRINAAK